MSNTIIYTCSLVFSGIHAGKIQEISNETIVYYLQGLISYNIIFLLFLMFCKSFSMLRFQLAEKLGVSNHYDMLTFK